MHTTYLFRQHTSKATDGSVEELTKQLQKSSGITSFISQKRRSYGFVFVTPVDRAVVFGIPHRCMCVFLFWEFLKNCGYTFVTLEAGQNVHIFEREANTWNFPTPFSRCISISSFSASVCVSCLCFCNVLQFVSLASDISVSTVYCSLCLLPQTFLSLQCAAVCASCLRNLRFYSVLQFLPIASTILVSAVSDEESLTSCAPASVQAAAVASSCARLKDVPEQRQPVPSLVVESTFSKTVAEPAVASVTEPTSCCTSEAAPIEICECEQ